MSGFQGDAMKLQILILFLFFFLFFVSCNFLEGKGGQGCRERGKRGIGEKGRGVSGKGGEGCRGTGKRGVREGGRGRVGEGGRGVSETLFPPNFE